MAFSLFETKERYDVGKFVKIDKTSREDKAA